MQIHSISPNYAFRSSNVAAKKDTADTISPKQLVSNMMNSLDEVEPEERATVINRVATTLYNHPEIDGRRYIGLAIANIPYEASEKAKSNYGMELLRLTKYSGCSQEDRDKVNSIATSLLSADQVKYARKYAPTSLNVCGMAMSVDEALGYGPEVKCRYRRLHKVIPN